MNFRTKLNHGYSKDSARTPATCHNNELLPPSSDSPWWFSGKEPTCQCRQWHPTPVLLPGKSHGRRSLVGCSPWGRYESDTTERLRFYFSLSSIGEGNGNPLQCSCLEKPRDRGAWWASVYGVAQSRTRLTWLSSSSSRYCQDGALLMPVRLWSWRWVLITFQRAISRRESVPEVGSEVERGILVANQKCLA